MPDFAKLLRAKSEFSQKLCKVGFPIKLSKLIFPRLNYGNKKVRSSHDFHAETR